jgi:hypothetical protein
MNTLRRAEGSNIWDLQSERSVITFGIVFCGAGVLCVCASLSSWRCALRFQANAVESAATVVSTHGRRGSLRFETDEGIVEVPIRSRGFHEPAGTKLRILYEPGAPEGWRQAPMENPSHELILAGVGIGISLSGVVMLVLGWMARRRSGRPFWL